MTTTFQTKHSIAKSCTFTVGHRSHSQTPLSGASHKVESKTIRKRHFNDDENDNDDDKWKLQFKYFSTRTTTFKGF